MSKNDVVVIYKFRTTSGKIMYYVWYDNNSADSVECFTFAEFRELIKGKHVTSNLKTAQHIASQIQKSEIPEYHFIVYDGYFNVLLVEDGNVNPSRPLQFRTNPEYLGRSEDDFSDDEQDFTDSAVPAVYHDHADWTKVTWELQTVNYDLSATAADLSVCKTEIDSLTQDVTQLESSVSDKQSEIDRYKSQMTAMNSMSAQVSNCVEMMSTRLEEYKQIIYARDEKIAELKHEIELLKSPVATETATPSKSRWFFN